MTDLVARFPVIARLLLGDYRATVDADWLRLRLDHGNWLPGDIVRMREMLPAALQWLLRDAGDDDSDD
jgi:hypothetical protein